MKTYLINGVLLTILSAVAATYQMPQTSVERPTQLKRELAVGLLRAINTTELVDQTKYGSYSSWPTLRERHSEYFSNFLNALVPNSGFTEPPQILPGWNLRMNVHSDGQGYDVLLRDVTDKKCGYATVTDENAVIRESIAIGTPGCELVW